MATMNSGDAPRRDPAGMFLTPAGRQILSDRLSELEEAAGTLQQRLAEGNTDELTAADYQRVSDEIARLTVALEEARSVEELPPDPQSVVLGDTVTVTSGGEADSYVIVDPLEAPLDDQRISSESPLGRALLGRRVGDEVDVNAPGGRYRYRIERADRGAGFPGPA